MLRLLGGLAFLTGEGTSTTTSSISSALTSALEDVQGDALSTIGSILPYALAIVGAGLVITLGVRYFKKISGK